MGKVCHRCGQEMPELDLSGIDIRAVMIATGVTERQVYRWRGGESRPTAKHLEIIREAGLI